MFTKLRQWIPLLGAMTAMAVLAMSCGTAEEPEATPTPTPVFGLGEGGVVATPTPSDTVATPTAAPSKQGGILRQTHRRSPLSFRLDVDSATDQTANVSPLFNSLLALQSPDFVSLGPDLATSWVIGADGKTFTFNLVPNIVNHNGNPWTSSDAKFTLETLTQKTENRGPHLFVSIGGVSNIESIETPDDNTLIVHLVDPDGLFLANMAQTNAAMYTEADYDETESLDNPVGTGPYKLTRHLAGEKLEFRAHDGYFKPEFPYLDGIDMFIIRNEAAKLAALEAKRIDLILMGSSHGLHAENLTALGERHPGELTFYAAQHTVLRAVKWNFRQDGPWQDKRVRQAINLAIDRDAVTSVLPSSLPGDWGPSGTYGVTDRDELAKKPGYARTGPAKDAEIAQAKQLMADAGYADGFEVLALCRDTGEYRDHFCPVMEFVLRDTLNIRMTLDVQESGAWTEKHDKTSDWFFEAGSTGSFRVDHPFDIFDHAFACGEGPMENEIGWCNEEFDDILRAMRVSADPVELQVLFDQAMDLFFEEMPYVPVFWPARWPVSWNYVQNVPDEHFSGQYSQARRLEQVWLDK
ncbi:MAG: ABC transporter substrate-binding protein [Dehalococcoidia bacterium]